MRFLRQSALLPGLFLLLLLSSAPTFAQAQNNPLAFQSLPDIPDAIGLGGPLVGTHEGALIVAGGANFPTPLTEGGAKVWHDRIFVLLPEEKTWRTLEQRLPRPLAYAACASLPQGIVVIGGSDEDTVHASVFLMRWDAAAETVTFEDLPDLPVPSAFGSAEAIGSTVFALAGKRSKDDTDLSGNFFALDLSASAPAWKPRISPPGPRRSKMVTAIQTGPSGEPCLFLFSGSRMTRTPSGDPRFEMFTDGYRYEPSTNWWERIADLPVLEDPRPIANKERHHTARWPINAACAMGQGSRTILTFSGSTGRYILDDEGQVTPPDTRPAFLNRVLAYDTIANTWSEAGQMPIGVVTTRAATWNGLIVIPSGETQPGIRTPAVQALPLEAASPTAATQPTPSFQTLDFIVLGLYLAVMVAVGIHFARREKSTEDFFLAGRKIPWWAAGLSIFGTQLSAITFMAIPAIAYGTNWSRFVGSLMLLPILVLVIICFLPLFRGLRITTAYEYLEARFSLAPRLLASALFVLFQLGRMGIVLLLPAIALSAVTGIDTYLCIALMGVLATIYTALGGISAVIWTDVLQVVVLIGGALLCLLVAINETGGLSSALEVARAADKFHMFDWRFSLTDMVAWVLIVGFAFTNLVPYTTDQTVIQRYLTTRDETEARRSLWLNFLITIPTGLLFFGLGTALFVYYQSRPDALATVPEKADQLVPWFVISALPSGIAGLIVAGIFAAAMSSLDSSMNSISTAIVNDFVDRLGRKDTSRNRLTLARTLTVILGLVGTGTAMVLATFEIRYMFDFFQKVIGLFGGSLAGVFILAAFTRRANTRGAVAGLLTGGALTLLVAFTTEVHFLLYAAIGTLGCVITGYLTSLLSTAPQKNLAGLTFATRRGDGPDVG